MDQLAKFGAIAGLRNLWNQLNSTQRVVVTAFLALSVVAVVFIGMVASKPRMSVLFSNLSSEDAGVIVQKLSELKVEYKLSTDGSTIEVPANVRDEMRLKMASQGLLPQGGSVGFEIFDKQSFGMTEFTEKLNYQRAIQGELTRTISQLAPVMGARVHIAKPESSMFSTEQQLATASVVLKLRRGLPLGDEQVGGIVQLVASAIEGLKPENVSVIDSDGNVLSECVSASSGAGGMLSTNQIKMKKQFENELSQNLQTMLAQIVGADKAVVRVSADLDFDHKQSKSEKFEPLTSPDGTARGVLLSEQKTSEDYNGESIPGNIAASASRATTNGSSAKGRVYNREESSSQYEVTKQIEETVSVPGKIKRLSVAVLVDEKVKSPIRVIQNAISAAAGIDPERKDQITVQKIKFDTVSHKALADEMAKASKGEMLQNIGKNAGAVVLLLLFLFFLKSIVKQIKVQAPVAPMMMPAMDPRMAPAPAMQGPADILQSVNSQSFAQQQQRPSNFDSSPLPQHEVLPAEVTQSNPEELAKLVRSWMSEQ